MTEKNKKSNPIWKEEVVSDKEEGKIYPEATDPNKLKSKYSPQNPYGEDMFTEEDFKVQDLTQQTPQEEYVKDNVLTDEECDELIEQSEKSMEKSTVVGKEIDGYRTSFNTFINKKSKLNSIKELNVIAKTLTDTDLNQHEDVCIVRYQEGQEYKAHHDYFCKKTMSEEFERGGDRIFSLLFFLNDGFEGGGTIFTKLNLEIRPKKGRLILWRNHWNGEQNVMSEHAGMPVESGIKYVAVKWIRESEFK